MADFDDRVKAFLEQHPQVRVGSEAWNAANKDIDLGDTFTAISKPLPNMVVLQTVDAATDKALVVAAFVNDEKAEAHFREVVGGLPGQSNKCTCPEGNCDAWRLRCYVCAFANETACSWDRKSCEEGE